MHGLLDATTPGPGPGRDDAADGGRPGRALAVDHLDDAAGGLEVLFVEDLRVGAAAPGGPRIPHRHDYHELFWTRSGRGRHLIDGHPFPVRPGTVTLVGRGQVHQLERAEELAGVIVRFREEMLFDGPAAGAGPGWLLHGRSRTLDVPAADRPRLEGMLATLAEECRRPGDACATDVRRHLLSALLLWVERWHDAARTGAGVEEDDDARLARRFFACLERDFARRHDAAHYATALGVPQAVLARRLGAVTGRGTKELITDRVVLEATRLLRFTDLSVGEVAFRTGFRDPLYFSRAFRRHTGEPPQAHRRRMRGRAA